MSRPNLELVTAFRTVAELLHFGQAAKRLHMSQPALTQKIQRLESELGVQLLQRDRRSVQLTQAGELLLAGAPDLLSHADELAMRIRQVSGDTPPTVLRIGFVSTASVEIIPAVVEQLRVQHPEIKLALRNLITSDQVKALNDGELEAGFLRLPIERCNLRTLLVHEEPFCLLMPRGHRLAKLASVPLTEAIREPQVIYSREGAPGYYEQMMNLLCSKEGFETTAQEASDMYSITALVASGFGVAIVPRSVARHRVSGCTAKPLSGRLPKAAIGLAARSSTMDEGKRRVYSAPRQAGLKELLAVCRSTFKTI